LISFDDLRDKKVLVAGVGDLLRSDDGFGPRVIRKLRGMNLPENVTVEDYGTSGLDLLFDLENFDEVIFVDAADFEGDVGEVRVIEVEPRKIDEREAIKSINFSLHEVDLEKIIDLANSLNVLPKKVTIIGCKPKDLSLGLKLSEEVEEAIDRAIEIILEKIKGIKG